MQLIKPVEHEPAPALEPPLEVDESQNRPITVTPSAAVRIRELAALKGRPEAVFRLRIVAGGCSSKEYQMDLVDTPSAGDRIIQQDGATVVVDFRSLVFLVNCTLDFTTDMFGAQFVVSNPNAKHSCSCGLSFSV